MPPKVRLDSMQSNCHFSTQRSCIGNCMQLQPRRIAWGFNRCASFLKVAVLFTGVWRGLGMMSMREVSNRDEPLRANS
ncbi:hypothetical protein HBI56_089920 [Parastagonospora nodorum]|nr:hypothetical protein HBH51_092980 [Parastagonospora nodorum]KAH3979440.1 hypothetical protein HBH52_100950 [Parastagonospora nodorum]KAH4048919.1 hypothetical protein HBH49_153000 [Parastagonospora nodorum]KAH4222132.1 hypothetical protein HBI06_147460 [Parastagonospora nodorum]KAH4228410.1 hypothetical protein HBI05_204890 [Parastagonospora nodorum]